MEDGDGHWRRKKKVNDEACDADECGYGIEGLFYLKMEGKWVHV